MKNSRKFKYVKNVIKGWCYKNIALRVQPITIPLDANDQLKRVFVLLRLLNCGNNIYIYYLNLVHYYINYINITKSINYYISHYIINIRMH